MCVYLLFKIFPPPPNNRSTSLTKIASFVWPINIMHIT